MLRQYLRKRTKIAWGFLNSYIIRRSNHYRDTEWWDKSFYVQGVSDRQTIAPDKDPLVARYHYSSIELQVLRGFCDYKTQTAGANVLDIGSGSGHWIEFYRSLGAATITAVDVSAASVAYLRKQYHSNHEISIHHNKASVFLAEHSGPYDIVNAIGVMFHVVDDSEWLETIHRIGTAIERGTLIVGGHFGILNGLDVQIDTQGEINKRLRSRSQWNNALKSAGFNEVRFYKNNAYLWIADHLPESNILLAQKNMHTD